MAEPSPSAAEPGALDVGDGVEVRVPLAELIAGLSDAAALGTHGPVEVIQTHISVVFLAGDRAYKVKKPLRLWGFLDYGTVALRRACCEDEVRLNRRLAPTVYRGVVPITRSADGRLSIHGDGEVVEHAVEMVRIPEGATFEERLLAGALDVPDIEAAARTLAAFHRAHALPERGRALARPATFASIVRQNFQATREAVPSLFPAVVHEGLARRLAARLRANRDLIRRRVAAGRMVDGHGDVRLEHVIEQDDHVAVIDCVEFSAKLRHIDPLSDLAFLSMDLAVRGRRDLAARLESAYLEHAGEDAETAARLLPLYLAYRAHVRAKVDHQMTLSSGVAETVRRNKARGARRYLALAWTYAREGEVPPIVILRGPSGTGKSVLASAIAPWLDAEVVRSDVVRKRLAGLAPTARVEGAAKDALYAGDMSERTYRQLLDEGLAAVRRGRAVLLDATYLRHDARRRVRAAARRAGAPFVILDLRCPEAVVRERIARRVREDADASDADFAVYRAQLAEQEALTPKEATCTAVYDAGQAPEDAVLRVLACIEARL
ncbi:MAG: bifunctional aminoglycoside phosphotransferase/ATP-binding protein [Planctomycetota bacterium]|jgi:aminoglycoside phosphotransferase family enzyme/predicted kinase